MDLSCIFASLIPKDKLKNFVPFIALLFFANGFAAFGQPEKNFIVKEDLRLNWFYFDQGEDVMLPFLDNGNHSPTAIHFSIPREFAQKAYLMVDVPAHTSLFLSNKFVQHFDRGKMCYFSMDSLSTVIRQESPQLTLYNKRGFDAPVEVKIGFLHNAFDTSLDVNPISLRMVDSKADYYKVIILILIAFFTVVRSLFPQELSDFMSFQHLFTFRYTDTLQAKYRSLTKSQSLVIVFQAALLAAILIILLNYLDNSWNYIHFLNINPVLGWLVLFGIILLLIILKYVLISAISSLFGMADRINFYFIEFLRMTMIFYFILFMVLGYVVINQFYLVQYLINGLIVAVIIFNVARVLMLYFKFRRTISIKSLHLFSYLCTTELIPIMIGINFFIK